MESDQSTDQSTVGEAILSSPVAVWITSAAILGPGAFLLRAYGENVPRGQATFEAVLVGVGFLPACAICLWLFITAIEDECNVLFNSLAIAIAMNAW